MTIKKLFWKVNLLYSHVYAVYTNKFVGIRDTLGFLIHERIIFLKKNKGKANIEFVGLVDGMLFSVKIKDTQHFYAQKCPLGQTSLLSNYND